MTTKVRLTWYGENRFVGWGAAGAPVFINSLAGEPVSGVAGGAEGPAGAAGPKPTELLLMAVGACTGLDIVSILGKQRVAFTGLDIDVAGERAPEHPKFFTDYEVVYRLKAAPEALPHLERAADLSMTKYCSVGLSLRARHTWKCVVEGGNAPDSGQDRAAAGSSDPETR